MVKSSGFQKAVIRSSALLGLGMVFASPHGHDSADALQLKPRLSGARASADKTADLHLWIVGGHADNNITGLFTQDIVPDLKFNWFNWLIHIPSLKFNWFHEYSRGEKVKAFIMPPLAYQRLDNVGNNGSYDKSPKAAIYEEEYLQQLVSIVRKFAADETGRGYLSLNSKSATMFAQLYALGLAVTEAEQAMSRDKSGTTVSPTQEEIDAAARLQAVEIEKSFHAFKSGDGLTHVVLKVKSETEIEKLKTIKVNLHGLARELVELVADINYQGTKRILLVALVNKSEAVKDNNGGIFNSAALSYFLKSVPHGIKVILGAQDRRSVLGLMKENMISGVRLMKEDMNMIKNLSTPTGSEGDADKVLVFGEEADTSVLVFTHAGIQTEVARCLVSGVGAPVQKG